MGQRGRKALDAIAWCRDRVLERMTSRKSVSTHTPFPSRYIFVWVPKTGGTSVYMHLGKPPMFFKSPDGIGGVDDVSQRLDAYDPSIHSGVTFGHASIRRLMREGIVTEDTWRDSFTFAFVRNPWDRFVSLYHYLEVQQITGMHFGRFVRYLYDHREIIPPLSLYNNCAFREGKDGRLGRLMGGQCRPQTEWIPDHIAFVGRFEHLDEDCRKIGLLAPGARLRRTNRSRHKSYQEYYDPEASRMVGSMYAADIARFSYELR